MGILSILILTVDTLEITLSFEKTCLPNIYQEPNEECILIAALPHITIIPDNIPNEVGFQKEGGIGYAAYPDLPHKLVETLDLDYTYIGLDTLNRVADRHERRLMCIQRWGSLAMADYMQFGMPASITMAQLILESNASKNKDNILFGVKHYKGRKGKRVKSRIVERSSPEDRGGDKVNKNGDHFKNEKSMFLTYDTPWDAFRDRIFWFWYHKNHKIRKDGGYRAKMQLFLNDERIVDYREWARFLKSCGYATDRNYVSKIIKLIDDYKLYLLDDMIIKIKTYNQKT